MKRIALIGDIVGSRKIKKRGELQRKLLKHLTVINATRRTLLSPYTITLGDEFQALYSSADELFKDIWTILLTLYPARVRFSISLGELFTRINKKQSIGMDGPAFHNARSGLLELKKTPYLFNISTDAEWENELAKQSLFLISQISGKWKSTRLKILIMLYEGMPVKEISNKLKISDKAVYKNIDSGGLNLVAKITKEIAKELNSLIKK